MEYGLVTNWSLNALSQSGYFLHWWMFSLFFLNEGNLKKKNTFSPFFTTKRKPNSINSIVHFIQNYILNENKFSSSNVVRNIGCFVTSNEYLWRLRTSRQSFTVILSPNHDFWSRKSNSGLVSWIGFRILFSYTKL